MLNKSLKSKRKGYAITLEVIMTLALIAMMLEVTTWLMSTMNAQRYMNTVVTSTTAQIAKWGGTDSKAYEANGMTYNIIENSQRELDNIVPESFDATISGGPSVISENNSKVYSKVSWNYPTVFGISIGSRQDVRIEMESIMRPGELLN